MRGRGTSHGCVSVLNGIVDGNGAVIGIDLETVAEATVGDAVGQTVDLGDGSVTDSLVRICARRTLEAVGLEDTTPFSVRVRSQIPPSRGLKSSSSVCNAVVGAVADACGFRMEDMGRVLLGVRCAKEAKVTVTGSFDDAMGCEFGGYIRTYNYRNEVLERRPFGEYDVVITVPDAVKNKTPRSAYEAVAAEMAAIREKASEDVMGATLDNGKLIARVTGQDPEPMERAMSLGAITAGMSGTGPATFAIVEKGEGKDFARRMGGNTIVARTRR